MQIATRAVPIQVPLVMHYIGKKGTSSTQGTGRENINIKEG
jgi:hypothetical protein